MIRVDSVLQRYGRMTGGIYKTVTGRVIVSTMRFWDETV
jgi:hypothetical protein